MKRISLFLIFLMISCVIMATNFYWYRTSNATSVSVGVFKPGDNGDDEAGGGEAGGGGSTPPGSNPGFVVFSTEGRIILTGSSMITYASDIYDSGSNAVGAINGNYPIKMSGTAFVDPDTLYIGPDASPNIVISVPDYGSYKDYREKVHNLNNFQTFPFPIWWDDADKWDFLIPDDIKNALPERGSLDVGWWPIPDEGFFIDKSGHYNKIDVKNSQIGLDIILGNKDLILHVDDFQINSGKVTIKRNGTGRLFIYADKFNQNGSGKIIANPPSGDTDYIFLFYSGTEKLTFAGDVDFPGTIFSERGDLEISGSGRIHEILSKGNTVKLNGGSFSARNVYHKNTSGYSEISGGADLDGGLMANGNTVSLSGGIDTLSYVFAPDANTAFSGSPKVEGSVIVKNLSLIGDSHIVGDRVIYPEPYIPVPSYEIDKYQLTVKANYPDRGIISDKSGNYPPDTQMSLTAAPNSGFAFVNWTDEEGNIISTVSDFDYTTLEKDTVLTANFEVKKYTLELVEDPVDGGSLSGSGEYDEGEVVNLTATPESNYTFDGWYDESGTLLSTEETYAYTMPAKDVKITGKFKGKGDWYLLTRIGYDLSNNVDIYGDIAVYRTQTVKIKNHTNIAGDIIIDDSGLVYGHTLEEIDGHNSDQYTAYQTELELPICECSEYGPYDKKAVDINDKKKELKVNNNAIIDHTICVPDGYSLHINGNSVINGDIIAPDTSYILINGNTVINGKICAPKATFDVKGQAQIKGPIYVYFLTMNNGSIGR